MVVYDGGGGIVASLGMEDIAPRCEGHGDTGKLRAQLDAFYEDLTAGLIGCSEFGSLCEDAAREYSGRCER